ncbi:MAG TPA: hypothetical protein VGL22_14515 [Terracidiphilus sp.]|jgi:hypothetical protein
MAIDRKFERDIDILLAEEFSVSPCFSDWFLTRTSKFKTAKAQVAGVYVSKSGSLGESDLVVLFDEAGENGSRFALLIEDKVNAPFMPDQAARYRLRGEHEVQNGQYTDYEIVLCSPAAYCVDNAKAQLFDSRVSYEDIGNFLMSCNRDDPRTAYRSQFISSAAKPGGSKWEQLQDDVTDRFWEAAYQIATDEFPELEMKKLRLTKGSTLINFRPREMPMYPRRYYIFLKGNIGLVDLTFSEVLPRLFLPLVKPILKDGMKVVRTGRSTAIRLEVSPFIVAEPDEAVMDKVRLALSASARLIRFYYENRSMLDQAAAQSLADPAQNYGAKTDGYS